MSFFFIQFLNGLASASSLFLVASGLSIIFGVSRIVNFAHGSFYMLGAYTAFTLVHKLGAGTVLGFWGALVLAAGAVAVVGAVVEMVLLRRIYQAPELLQLLATFGLVLIVQDLVLVIWGPEDLLGPRAPGLKGAIDIFGQSFPQYDFVLIILGPVVLALLWLLFHRTRWGTLIRAATQDREMVGALGVDQAKLFTSVFTLGAFLAGLGGAVQLPREAVNHVMDLQIITEAFVIVVIGGLGSVLGAFLAAVIIGELNAFGILIFPQLTLVLTFLVMAVILVVRPWGLLGKPEMVMRGGGGVERPIKPLSLKGRNAAFAVLVVLLALPIFGGSYGLSVASEVLIFALFAASLHFMMGTGGMVSFGHAAYFGLGSYGAALMVKYFGIPMLLALVTGPLLAALAAMVFGWFCVRLAGVYLAMLTLAFAQIAYAVVFQWSSFTGGDNGLIGIWPAPWAANPVAFYYLTLLLCGGAILAIRRITFAPFGYTLRACRDSALRADSIGINLARHRWAGFSVAGFFAGIAGALYAFLKGSVFPDTISIATSVDGLVMVLLGGVQTLAGPIVGALTYKTLHVTISSYTDQWRTVLGLIIIVLVVAFPQGIVGFASARLARSGAKEDAA